MSARSPRIFSLWKGLEHEDLQTEKTRSPLLSYPVGTMLDSIYKTWRWPRVVGKVKHNPKNPLEYAKIWRITQQAAAGSGRPVKFGTCSAQVLAFFLDSHTPNYSLDDKKQLIWDMAEAMNRELRQLAASGCKVIQVEEPTLHFMARYSPEKKDLLDFLVDAFNREVDGLDGVEVWIHTCWGNPNMQKVFSDESYANSMEIYLERIKGDVWTIEATENNFRELSLFDRFKNSLKKKVAVGVINHRTLQADFPDVIAERIRRCLKHIPADKLILSSDCGFGRQLTKNGSDPLVCGSHGECDAPSSALSKVMKRQPMKHPTPDYPMVAFGEALRSLTGAGVAMFVVCAMGGAVPTVAGWRYLPGTEDWVFLTVAWVWHWAIAGLMFWGLLALLVPVWSFHELLHGNGNPFLALAAALITQLIVSTVAVCIVEYEYERIRPIAASGGLILFVVAAMLWVSRSTTKSSSSRH